MFHIYFIPKEDSLRRNFYIKKENQNHWQWNIFTGVESAKDNESTFLLFFKSTDFLAIIFVNFIHKKYGNNGY